MLVALEGKRLVDMLHLVVMGMRLAVGRQQSVNTEVPVVGLVAKVAIVPTVPQKGSIP